MIRIKKLTQNNTFATITDSKETNLNQLLTKLRDINNLINKIIESGEVPQNIDDKLYIGDVIYTSSELLKQSYKLIQYLSEISGNYKGNEVFAAYAKDLDLRYVAMQGKIDQFITTMQQQEKNNS
jgi:hypothetical protein